MESSQGMGSQLILDRLAEDLFGLPAELRKVASYILDNPNEVGVASARGLARAAGARPNSVVRLARRLGFAGHDALKAVFQDEIRQGASSFPDRARWLRALSAEGRLGGLFADMAESAIANIEATFAGTDADRMQGRQGRLQGTDSVRSRGWHQSYDRPQFHLSCRYGGRHDADRAEGWHAGRR